jgi:hypothetical protein
MRIAGGGGVSKDSIEAEEKKFRHSFGISAYFNFVVVVTKFSKNDFCDLAPL